MSPVFTGVLVALGIIFWAIRIWYWSITEEIPFSDMADFQAVADRVYAHGSFAWSDFWQSYMLPTLPALRALQMYITGPSLEAWQYFQALLLFVSALWLLREVWMVTKSHFLVVTLSLAVTFSRASIFWSYKFSRESLAEALFYCCGAAIIWACRRKAGWQFLIVGMLLMVAIFNRANTLLALGMIVAWLAVVPSAGGETVILRVKRSALVVLGAFIIWLPWGVRGYMLYGAPVVLSTQGPFVFFWELGRVPVQVTPTEVKWVHAQDLQAEVATTFPSDYEAARYASSLIRAWLRDHWRELIPVIKDRIVSTATGRTIYLTRVSREDLFPGKWDNYLPEKDGVVFTLGMIGLLISGMFSLVAAPLAILVIGSWLNALPVLGYPRVVESSIPLLFWGIALLSLHARYGFLRAVSLLPLGRRNRKLLVS